MIGPAYRKSSSDRGVLKGIWSDETVSQVPRDVQFEIRLDSAPLERRYHGWQGYQKVKQPAQKGQLPDGWKPFVELADQNHYTDGYTVYASPNQFELLDLWEILDKDNRVFCDGRSLSKRELIFYHTLPFLGWLQESPVLPPDYRAREIPNCKNSEEPLFCLVHGFTGDPKNWIHITDHLDEGPWSYSVPLLPGHSLNPKNFEKYGKESWETCLEVMMNQLSNSYDRRIGIGLSMGGALLLKWWEFFDAIVVINTPVDIPDWRRFFLPLLNLFKRNYDPRESDKVFPLSSLREMGILLREASRNLENVECPVLVISSNDDETVSVGHARYLRSKIPEAEHIRLTSGGHESPTDKKVARRIVEAIGSWLMEKDISVPAIDKLKQ